MANNNTELKGWAKYCKEQNIEFSTKRIFIDGLGGMAHGLFASLLIGCIINTIGMYVPLLKDIVVNPWMSDKLAGENLLIASKTAAYAVQGAAMAAAIAYSMKAPPFVMYSTLAVGFAANALGAQGGPLAVFFVVVIAVFLGKLVSKRTPIDIIVTPFVTIVFGVLFAFLIAPPIGKGAVLLGDLVMKATALQPFWMGILVSALMGIILTLPISSAAICAGLGLVGLAGGACVAGCSAHMVGFAVASYRAGSPVSGPRHLHAPGSQPGQETHPLAAPRGRFHRERPARHLPVQAPDERRCHQLRHGHLRPLRPDRPHHRLGGPRVRRERCSRR